MDPFTGRNPSYCFVDLVDADEARRAIETLNGTSLLGRVLKVKPCVIKKPSQGKDQPVIDRWARTDAEGYWRGVGDKEVRLFVAGLPKPGSQVEGEKMMREIFSGFKVYVQISAFLSEDHP
jgi:RNA recognition motif-containing protein